MNKKIKNEGLEAKIDIKKKLLLIDDNLNYVLYGFNTISKKGYDVDYAFDLESAMKKISSEKYDAVITDLMFFQQGIQHKEDLPYLRDRIKGYTTNQKGEIIIKYSDFEKFTDYEKNSLNKIIDDYEVIAQKSEKRNPDGSMKIVDSLCKNRSDVESILDATFVGREGEFDKKMGLDYIYNKPLYNVTSGVIVSQECEKKKMPCAVITSLSHGQHTSPFLADSSIVKGGHEELVSKLRELKRLNTNASGEYNNFLGAKPYEVIGKAIVVGGGKGEQVYLAALNIVEAQMK